MPFSLWVDQLIIQVINHLNSCHSGGWTYTAVDRGAYFYRLTWAAYRLGQNHDANRPAYHFFLNNDTPTSLRLHCAAKLETDKIAACHINNIPPAVHNLFNNAADRNPRRGGIEIAWREIDLPNGFNVIAAQQALKPNLWKSLLTQFFLNNPTLDSFLNLP